MITHPRRLIIGKTLNYQANVSGNLTGDLTGATVSTDDEYLTIGSVDFETNPITFAALGVSAGLATVEIEYQTATESDCVKLGIIVEEC
jgi:hypothetical protein